MPGIKGKRPTIVARQRRETLHRGAVDALIYHLIERKGAALASAINVGESNRRGSEFGGIRTVTVAGSAMSARTILDEKGLPTGKIGHSGWSERDRIGFEQIAGQTMGKKIGRAHVRTPVTHAHLVCRRLLEKK